MVNSVKLIPTGFDFIDSNWGGVYRGGSYLIVGSKTSAKSLFTLKFIEQSISKGKCLYFTSLRPKDLFIQASTINFDLENKLLDESATLIRVLSVPQNIPQESIDNYLIEYLQDIIEIIKKYKPGYLVFDEFSEFVKYQNAELLRQKFLDMLEALEDYDVTSFFVITESTAVPKENYEKFENCFTGIIKFKDPVQQGRGDKAEGIVSIKPNVGHLEGQFSAGYCLQLNKGLTVKSQVDEIVKGFDSPSSQRIKIYKPSKPVIANAIKEIGISKRIGKKKISEAQEFSFSNIYEYNDFQLIINTHIALYNATKQKYHLVCFKLNEKVANADTTNLDQFRNAVITAVDKKDKICFVDNNVFVLIVKSKDNSVNQLSDKVVKNLRDKKHTLDIDLLEQINVKVIEPENHYKNSSEVLESLISFEKNLVEKFTPLIKYIS